MNTDDDRHIYLLKPLFSTKSVSKQIFATVEISIRNLCTKVKREKIVLTHEKLNRLLAFPSAIP